MTLCARYSSIIFFIVTCRRGEMGQLPSLVFEGMERETRALGNK